MALEGFVGERVCRGILPGRHGCISRFLIYFTPVLLHGTWLSPINVKWYLELGSLHI